MASPPTLNQPQGLGLGDIYYVLFRHKWKIVSCALAGIAAAAVVYKFFPPPFQSEAKLFVRYVVNDGKVAGPTHDDATAKSPDQRGETIMASELEILSSLDLARQVADAVGPERILAKKGGGKDLNRAATIVRKGLVVDVPLNSSVIRIVFEHPDPDIVQPVLREVIDNYLKMHVEIHRAVGLVGDFLTQETDQLRSRLAETEEELSKASAKVGVVSIDDAKRADSEEMDRIRQDIFSAQAELAERSAIFQEATKHLTPTASTTAVGPQPEISQDLVEQYQIVDAHLEQLRKQEQELLTQFTEENLRVKAVRAQIADAEALKSKLEKENPDLTHSAAAAARLAAAGTKTGAIDLEAESDRLVALQSKIKVLNSQLDQIRAEEANVNQAEGSISELKRRKDLEEANYRYYSASLEQARINEALGNGRVSNISQIQSPSPPFNDWSKFMKVVAEVAGSGLLIGLVWAFSIELYFDRSVRRPIDIERMLGVPLMLSIPDVRRSGFTRRLKAASKATLALPAPANRADSQSLEPETNPLHEFHETLRDRLIGNFESRNLKHKPKLVAITGLGQNSGVTTIASGLATSLSQTGEGNVLLVDMTVGQGSAQQFYKGKAVCGIDELLDTRDTAQVQGKLYVVGEEPNSDRLSRALPQRFSKLVPKLKASDFDYIIFDMPPVSQISVTPRLSGFMDIVLMVIESEKTDRDVVRRAAALLAESKASVGVVLNKTQIYAPSWLHQEFLLS
jgi:uncharacterized protein involved in exopolysaccharide biosynthesis